MIPSSVLVVKRPPRTRGSCGRISGFELHRRNDEDPCGPCREARRTYNRNWMRKKRLRPLTHLADLALCDERELIYDQQSAWLEDIMLDPLSFERPLQRSS